MARPQVMTESRKAELRTSARLSSLESPPQGAPVVDAFTLMDAIVGGATNDGLNYADPWLLRRSAWWQDDWDSTLVGEWIGTLVEWGEITLEPLGRNCYSPDRLFNVIVIQNRRRFKRWHPRPSFTAAQRVAVYARDNGSCVHCGATDSLSVDHIYPWSKGGAHEMENFQTLCRSCNSRKGARI